MCPKYIALKLELESMHWSLILHCSLADLRDERDNIFMTGWNSSKEHESSFQLSQQFFDHQLY